MPAVNTYSRADVAVLNIRLTPIKKQPETLLYLVGLSQRYFLGDDVYPTFLHDDDRDIDLFNLISAPNPSKVKTGLRSCAAHEVPLLTDTASQVIDMEDLDVATKSTGTPFAIKKSPLDFDNENPSLPMTKEVSLEEEVAAMRPRLSKKRCRRVNDGVDANAPPKVKNPTDDETPTENVATMEVQDTHSAKSAGSGKSTSSSSMVGSPGGIYQPGWGMTNNCRLDTPDVCQDVVDHIVPPGYFSDLRHMPNAEFLSQYNKNLAQYVAIGSQLRLRLEQEPPHLVIRPLGEQRSANSASIDSSNPSHREERIKAAFKEFKKYKDDRVRKRYSEMDGCVDALSIDFDDELYPYMLTAIAGCRWVIRHGLRLAIMKCAESIELRQAFANVMSVGIAKGMSEGTPRAERSEVPNNGSTEGFKGCSIEVIMASLHLESDSEEDAPKWIRDLRPSISQLKIPVYLEVRDPRNPRAIKEEMLLKEAIAANVSHVKKKKRRRVVCRIHGVGFTHHARFDGVPVSVPIDAPQGLAILLADATIQT
nr:hypothetical protein [Tanacetum cinerariifolium]